MTGFQSPSSRGSGSRPSPSRDTNVSWMKSYPGNQFANRVGAPGIEYRHDDTLPVAHIPGRGQVHARDAFIVVPLRRVLGVVRDILTSHHGVGFNIPEARLEREVPHQGLHGVVRHFSVRFNQVGAGRQSATNLQPHALAPGNLANRCPRPSEAEGASTMMQTADRAANRPYQVFILSPTGRRHISRQWTLRAWNLRSRLCRKKHSMPLDQW